MQTFPPPDTPPVEAPTPQQPPRRRRRVALIAGGTAAALALVAVGVAVAVSDPDEPDAAPAVDLAAQTDEGTPDELSGVLEELGAFGECAAERLDDVDMPDDPTTMSGEELATTIADGLRTAADAVEACAEQLPDDLGALLDLPMLPGLLPEGLDELKDELEQQLPTLDELKDELDEQLPSLDELQDELEQQLPTLDELQDELGGLLDDALQGEDLPAELDRLLDDLLGTSDADG